MEHPLRTHAKIPDTFSAIVPMKTGILLCLILFSFPAIAQDQQIGIIDFYGLRKIQERQVRAVLGLAEGDTLPLSLPEIEQRMKDTLRVAAAHLSVVCCDDSGRMILFVGIQETPLKHPMYRPSPHWDISLPQEISDAYNHFLDALEAAVSKGITGDDLSRGYSLMADSAVRSLQERFLGYARHNLKILQTVVRNSEDPEQRAAAAYILGYASDKRLVTNDLLLAAVDEDEVVRNNAARALAAIATLAQRKPGLRIKISSAPFMNLLSSPLWTDRNKALMVLAVLTKNRDRKLLRQLRDRAFEPLVEMARWKSKGHAYNAFLVLGRVAGISDRQINRVAWDIRKRNALIEKIVKTHRRR